MLFEAKSTTVYPDHTDYDRETVLTVSFPALQCVNPMPNVASNTRVATKAQEIILFQACARPGNSAKSIIVYPDHTDDQS